MKKYLFSRNHYFTTLTFLMSFLAGCFAKKKNYIEKKLFLPESKCAQPRIAKCSSDTYIPGQEAKDSATEQPTVTVWVHGTRETMRTLQRFKLISRFFYTHNRIHPIETLERSMHHRTIGESLIEGDPENYPRGHIYMFGWSGRLSFESRENAARELYCELTSLIKRYQDEYGYTPKIRLITHSHGGNVALNLAAIKNEFTSDLSIDELILLACPVQDHTEDLVNNPIFKRIYSLYSNKDFIQVLDAQGSYPTQKHKTKTYFSRRRFKPAPNLVQVKIKINRRSIAHIEFMLRRFIRMIPWIIQEANSWEKDTCLEPDTEMALTIYTHPYKHPERLK